jgi:hypothetical protein
MISPLRSCVCLYISEERPVLLFSLESVLKTDKVDLKPRGRISTASGSERDFWSESLARAALAIARGTDSPAVSRGALFHLRETIFTQKLPDDGIAIYQLLPVEAAMFTTFNRDKLIWHAGFIQSRV